MPDFVVDLNVIFEVRVHVSDVDDEQAAVDHAKEVYDAYLPNWPTIEVDSVTEEPSRA